MTDYNVARDRWGKPFVTTDGGPLVYEGKRKTPSNAVAYGRVSNLAGLLDDKGNLTPWACAMAMMGVVREPSIHAQVGSLMSKHARPWDEAKTQMKQLVRRAKDAAAADNGSGQGTAFHELTEVVDEGGWPQFLPPHLEPWLQEYAKTMQNYEVILAEGFVVVDELQVAGSFDKLLLNKATGVVRIGDLKTGKSDPFYPLKAMIQFAAYAHGELYDQESGSRSVLHSELDMGVAEMIHVPILSGGVPHAAVYPVDIAAGWGFAKLAVEVAAAREAGKRALVAV